MRVVSWVVIVGSVSALVYRGVGLLVDDEPRPSVEAERTLSAMADERTADRLEACIRERAGNDVPTDALDGVVEPGTPISKDDLEEIGTCRHKHLARN